MPLDFFSNYGFFSLLSITALSFVFGSISKTYPAQTPWFIRLQYVLLGLFAITWFWYEQAIFAEGANIRIDLFVILPCAITQLTIFVISHLSTSNNSLLKASQEALKKIESNKKGA